MAEPTEKEKDAMVNAQAPSIVVSSPHPDVVLDEFSNNSSDEDDLIMMTLLMAAAPDQPRSTTTEST